MTSSAPAASSYGANMTHRFDVAARQCAIGLELITKFADFFSAIYPAAMLQDPSKLNHVVSDEAVGRILQFEEQYDASTSCQHIATVPPLLTGIAIKLNNFLHDIIHGVIHPAYDFVASGKRRLAAIVDDRNVVFAKCKELLQVADKERAKCLQAWHVLYGLTTEKEDKIKQHDTSVFRAADAKVLEKLNKKIEKAREQAKDNFARYEILVEQCNRLLEQFHNVDLVPLLEQLEALEKDRLIVHHNMFAHFNRHLMDTTRVFTLGSETLQAVMSTMPTPQQSIQNTLDNWQDKHGLPPNFFTLQEFMPCTSAQLATDLILDPSLTPSSARLQQLLASLGPSTGGVGSRRGSTTVGSSSNGGSNSSQSGGDTRRRSTLSSLLPAFFQRGTILHGDPCIDEKQEEVGEAGEEKGRGNMGGNPHQAGASTDNMLHATSPLAVKGDRQKKNEGSKNKDIVEDEENVTAVKEKAEKKKERKEKKKRASIIAGSSEPNGPPAYPPPPPPCVMPATTAVTTTATVPPWSVPTAYTQAYAREEVETCVEKNDNEESGGDLGGVPISPCCGSELEHDENHDSDNSDSAYLSAESSPYNKKTKTGVTNNDGAGQIAEVDDDEEKEKQEEQEEEVDVNNEELGGGKKEVEVSRSMMYSEAPSGYHLY